MLVEDKLEPAKNLLDMNLSINDIVNETDLLKFRSEQLQAS